MKNIIHAKYCMAILASSFLFSCSDEDSNSPKIDPRAKEYVDLFYFEAEKRGLNLDKSKLTLQFTNELVLDDGREYGGRGWNHFVEISEKSWEGYDQYEREVLIFHELGHAILARRHFDVTFNTGSPVSIMHSRVIGPFKMYRNESLYKKEYYLDELLTGKRNPVPEWSIEKKNLRLVFSDSISADPKWKFYSSSKNEPDLNTAIGEVTDLESSTGDYSLMIKGISSLEKSHYWRLEIQDFDIQAGNAIELRVKIKDENLEGNRILIALRGDNLERNKIFFFSEREIFPTNAGFIEYSIQFDHFYSDVDTIVLFLVMQEGTTGTLYFDDIEVYERY